MLPSFASASLPFTKALACQTAIIGGGASFSLYFPQPKRGFDSGHLVSLGSSKGYFVCPESFYRPAFLDAMHLGSERLEAFLAFQSELLGFLFPFIAKAFPLCKSLGSKRFLSSVLSYGETYESRKAWLLLPDRKGAEA
jgi:hypothetical protein